MASFIPYLTLPFNRAGGLLPATTLAERAPNAQFSRPTVLADYFISSTL